MKSDQNLYYRVHIFTGTAFRNADLDLDKKIATVDFDLYTFGTMDLNTGKYYLDVETNIAYEDEALARSLYCSLENWDTVAKIAGATGEVVLVFHLEPLAGERNA